MAEFTRGHGFRVELEIEFRIDAHGRGKPLDQDRHVFVYRPGKLFEIRVLLGKCPGNSVHRKGVSTHPRVTDGTGPEAAGLDARLYDGSMTEWAQNPDLPLVLPEGR